MLVIIQARMTSKRLPGKVLMAIESKSILQWVIDRLRCCNGVSKLVVATSRNGTDDEIERECNREGVQCHRGPLDNVAKRFLETALKESAKSFTRINADSPFIDPDIVNRAIDIFNNNECDLVTNVMTRSFPIGQSVEVIDVNSFQRMCSIIQSESEREHVTKHYYENPENYKIIGFQSHDNFGHVRLAVDTESDYLRLKSLLRHFNGQPADWRTMAKAMQGISSISP